MAEELKRTLLKDGYAEITEKKSRFIGYACPVKTEEEAIAFVDKIRKKHSDARHNVYAYAVGRNTMRYSDDGEPQGTGGIPVLDVIRKTGFTDAAIVVTRYFGGILLGTGGLTRAYSEAAKLAVENAGIVTYELLSTLSLTLPYQDFSKISRYIQSDGFVTESIDYSDNVTAVISVRVSKTDRVIKDITEMTSGKYIPEKIGEKYGII